MLGGNPQSGCGGGAEVSTIAVYISDGVVAGGGSAVSTVPCQNYR